MTRRPSFLRRGRATSDAREHMGGPVGSASPDGHEPRACAAPHSSLYFEPSGLVTTCCANSAYVLGRIHDGDTSDTLRSIWNGVRTATQREALDAGDYSLGCSECAAGVGAGNRDLILARDFDRYWGQLGGDYPLYMDFALSNTCNLQCEMCNGDLSSAIRSQREGRAPLPQAYGERFFAELAEFLPHLRDAQFKGGEPFLTRESRRIWDMLLELEHRPRITVTTNGTQWNDRVEHYVRELQMHVILSVDGTTAATVEAIRSGTEFSRLQEHIERFHVVTSESGGSLVLNYCLMPQNWHEFGAFLVDAESRELHVHAIPVVAPPRFDLLSLPMDELTEIVGELEREGRSIEPLLGRNAAVWSAQVSRLRRGLEQRTTQPAVESIPVKISDRQPDLDALRAQMADDSDAPLLEIEFEGGQVAAVDSPEWADQLLVPSGWIGLGEHDIPARLADALHLGFPEIRTQDHGSRTLHVTLDFPGDDRVRLNAVTVLESDTGKVERLLIAKPAPQRVTPHSR